MKTLTITNDLLINAILRKYLKLSLVVPVRWPEILRRIVACHPADTTCEVCRCFHTRVSCPACASWREELAAVFVERFEDKRVMRVFLEDGVNVGTVRKSGEREVRIAFRRRAENLGSCNTRETPRTIRYFGSRGSSVGYHVYDCE